VGLSLTGTGSGLVDRVVILIFVGGAALAAYAGMALLLKTEEMSSAASLLRGQLMGNEE
jgi:hypothetical protein